MGHHLTGLFQIYIYRYMEIIGIMLTNRRSTQMQTFLY